MWFSCIVQSGLFPSPGALTSLQGWCASVCVSSAALCVTSIGGVGSPGCRQLVLGGYEKHGGVYTWLSQEEMDWHGIDEAKGREEHRQWRCRAEDAAGQPRGCAGTGTQHPSLPAPVGRGSPLCQDRGCPGQTSKQGENIVSLS